MKLTIYASPITNSQLPITAYEVSYRLTAPRFDSRDWTNYNTGSWEGMNLDKYLEKYFKKK